MKSRVWRGLTLGIAAIGLSACGGETEAPVPANPDAPPGISVSDAQMNLPAVAGNPAAVYFSITNDSDQQAIVRAANVAGAESAMMHQTAKWDNQSDMQEVFQLAVPARETLILEPGGLHVMAMNVAEDLAPGDTTEVTLTFVGGDKISFPASILAPGESD